MNLNCERANNHLKITILSADDIAQHVFVPLPAQSKSHGYGTCKKVCQKRGKIEDAHCTSSDRSPYQMRTLLHRNSSMKYLHNTEKHTTHLT